MALLGYVDVPHPERTIGRPAHSTRDLRFHPTTRLIPRGKRSVTILVGGATLSLLEGCRTRAAPDGLGAFRVFRPASSKLYLRPQLHHAIRRDPEERRRRLGVPGHENEELLSPTGHRHHRRARTARWGRRRGADPLLGDDERLAAQIVGSHRQF